MSAMPTARRAAVVAGLLAVWALPASAQTAPARSARPPVWEIEGFGGFVPAGVRSGGTSTLPDPGSPIATSSPIFPSRQ